MWHYIAFKNIDCMEVRELFIDDINGDVYGWTAEKVEPHGETINELQKDLIMMLSDISKYPVYCEEDGELKRIDGVAVPLAKKEIEEGTTSYTSYPSEETTETLKGV